MPVIGQRCAVVFPAVRNGPATKIERIVHAIANYFDRIDAHYEILIVDRLAQRSDLHLRIGEQVSEATDLFGAYEGFVALNIDYYTGIQVQSAGCFCAAICAAGAFTGHANSAEGLNMFRDAHIVGRNPYFPLTDSMNSLPVNAFHHAHPADGHQRFTGESGAGIAGRNNYIDLRHGSNLNPDHALENLFRLKIPVESFVTGISLGF